MNINDLLRVKDEMVIHLENTRYALRLAEDMKFLGFLAEQDDDLIPMFECNQKQIEGLKRHVTNVRKRLDRLVRKISMYRIAEYYETNKEK